MIGQLTTSERQAALIILIVLAVGGLVMTVAGRGDPLGSQGVVVILMAVAGVFAVISAYYAPEPSAERLGYYYDDPTKAGIVLAMAWAAFGLSPCRSSVWRAISRAFSGQLRSRLTRAISPSASLQRARASSSREVKAR